MQSTSRTGSPKIYSRCPATNPGVGWSTTKRISEKPEHKPDLTLNKVVEDALEFQIQAVRNQLPSPKLYDEEGRRAILRNVTLSENQTIILWNWLHTGPIRERRRSTGSCFECRTRGRSCAIALGRQMALNIHREETKTRVLNSPERPFRAPRTCWGPDDTFSDSH